MAVDFDAKQREFVNYIRNPDTYPAPADVDSERMAIYRELFFNNIESFLSANFPVLRALMDNESWLSLAQDFFSRHACRSPYFSEIAEEFLNFLETERNGVDDFPFMFELAHYEWVEMAVDLAQDELTVNQPIGVDFAERIVQLSPLAWPLVYRYPVHRISKSYQPHSSPEQPTCLIVHRDLEDRVRFIEITPLSYALLESISENPRRSVNGHLDDLVQATKPPDPTAAWMGGMEFLQELAEKNIVTIVS